MKEQKIIKILMWIFLIIGLINWIIGFLKNIWQAAVAGVLFLCIFMCLQLKLRILKIKK